MTIGERVWFEMTKKEIEEAAAWSQKLRDLNEALTSWKKTCKHWSLGELYETQNSHAQFPDNKWRDCEFCGRAIKQ